MLDAVLPGVSTCMLIVADDIATMMRRDVCTCTVHASSRCSRKEPMLCLVFMSMVDHSAACLYMPVLQLAQWCLLSCQDPRQNADPFKHPLHARLLRQASRARTHCWLEPRQCVAGRVSVLCRRVCPISYLGKLLACVNSHLGLQLRHMDHTYRPTVRSVGSEPVHPRGQSFCYFGPCVRRPLATVLLLFQLQAPV
jgi:hypothetical protein